MKSPRLIVAGVTFGIAVSPYCAHHVRPNRVFFDSSLEEWFVSALKGGDAWPIFRLVVILCAIAGLLIGLLLAKAIRPSDGNSQGGMSLLRTPLAAGIFTPFAFAASVFVAYNHTPRLLNEIVWPEFVFKVVIFYSVVIGMASAILAGFLYERAKAYPQATFFEKLKTICCLPLAVLIGLASVVGMVGAGLLCGLAIGNHLGCPITGVWMGGCLAVALLAIQSDIFWPAYFPLVAHGGK